MIRLGPTVPVSNLVLCMDNLRRHVDEPCEEANLNAV